MNNCIAGYNVVINIPKGATNIDIQQHSYSGKPEDDNYLGKSLLHVTLVDSICALPEVRFRCMLSEV